MKRMVHGLVLGWLFAGSQATGLAAQRPDGATLLARVDSVMNAPPDVSGTERMILIDSDGSTTERSLQFFQKGSEKRLVRFLSPADVRGVGFLRLASDRMYLYLPAFRRVRRIASSIKNQDFMGTDFTYEDVSQTAYATDYVVTDVRDGEESYTLTLEPKAEADVSYGRLVMEVLTSNWVVSRIDYFDSGGERVKTLTASEIELVDGYWYARRLEMVSWLDDHRTVLELQDLRLDTGLSDDLFTQRALKRRV